MGGLAWRSALVAQLGGDDRHLLRDRVQFTAGRHGLAIEGREQGGPQLL